MYASTVIRSTSSLQLVFQQKSSLASVPQFSVPAEVTLSGLNLVLPKSSPIAGLNGLLGGFIFARLNRRDDPPVSPRPPWAPASGTRLLPPLAVLPMVKEKSADWREGAIQL